MDVDPASAEHPAQGHERDDECDSERLLGVADDGEAGVAAITNRLAVVYVGFATRLSSSSRRGAEVGLVLQPAGAWVSRLPIDHDVAVRYGTRIMVVVGAALALTACGSDAAPAGTYELPSSQADEYPTAYVDVVVADPPGDDLAEGAGEYVVIANNATIRIDMGGWWLDVGGERLPLGIGRQVDVATELRVYPGPGETTEDAVFVGLDKEVLDDDGGDVLLRDAAGTEVSTFRYGTAG